MKINNLSSKSDLVQWAAEVNIMPRPLQLVLSIAERRELERVRDHDPEPYLREKAAALLKIAGGSPAVMWRCMGCSSTGVRTRCTTGSDATEPQGLQAYGCNQAGTKTGFFPLSTRMPPAPERTAARAASRPAPVRACAEPVDLGQFAGQLQLVAPQHPGRPVSTLGAPQDQLQVRTDYIHSRTPLPGELDLIADCLRRARNDCERYVLVYEDELTYYRQPTLSSAFEVWGMCNLWPT